METTIVLLALAASLAVIATAAARRRHAWRWDAPRAVVIRGGVVRGLHAGPPLWLSAASAVAVLWGMLTAVIFAPLGLLYVVIACASGQIAMAISGVLMAAVAINGFAIGAALMRSGILLMSRDRDELRGLIGRTLAHHVAVLAALIPAGLEAVAMASIPCVAGGAIAALLYAGYRRT